LPTDPIVQSIALLTLTPKFEKPTHAKINKPNITISAIALTGRETIVVLQFVNLLRIAADPIIPKS
jgi:hypothetical protein